MEQNWIWKDPRKAVAWIHILFRANYEEKKVLIDGEEVLVPRGAFITSIRKLADETFLSIQEIRTFLKVLESNTMINTVATHKLTQITVCNYEEYQSDQHSDVSKSTQQSTSEKEEIKKKEKNPPISPQESFAYLPEEFLTPKFKSLWIKWWQHRKSQKWTTRISYAESACADLQKLAGNDVSTAIRIVEQSMSKGWQGLFAVKNGQPGYKRRASHGTKKEKLYDESEVEIISTKNANK
jgi:hypothetical protein